MTEQQIRELQTRLSSLRSELEARLKANAGDSKPVSLDDPIGRLSRMDAIQQQQMVAGTRRRMEEQLQQVRAAIGRIESSRYGFCLRCEEPVGYERLKIRPEATLCLECQSSLE